MIAANMEPLHICREHGSFGNCYFAKVKNCLTNNAFTESDTISTGGTARV